MNRRRVHLSGAGPIALAIAVVAALAVIVVGLPRLANKPVPRAGQVIGYSPPPTPPPLGVPLHPLSNNRVFILGDSWTSGFGSADPSRDSWAAVAARTLHWDATISPQPGVGFERKGTAHQWTFAGFLRARTPSSKYSLLVIQGGLNDSGPGRRAHLPAGFKATITAARVAFPKAQIVVVGPISPIPSYDKEAGVLSSLIGDLCLSEKVAYMNGTGLDWMPTALQPKLINTAHGHPNAAGYAAMAAGFVKTFRHAISVGK